MDKDERCATRQDAGRRQEIALVKCARPAGLGRASDQLGCVLSLSPFCCFISPLDIEPARDVAQHTQNNNCSPFFDANRRRPSPRAAGVTGKLASWPAYHGGDIMPAACVAPARIARPRHRKRAGPGGRAQSGRPTCARRARCARRAPSARPCSRFGRKLSPAPARRRPARAAPDVRAAPAAERPLIVSATK